MHRLRHRTPTTAALLLVALLLAARTEGGREIPSPLPSHPGNVFLSGEEVRVRVEPSVPASASSWRVLDDRGKRLSGGPLDRTVRDGAAPLSLGKLGVGWYRVEFLSGDAECVRWTSAAVLARLTAPTPADSPICVDSASAWFAQDDPTEQERLANLAALAGVNWVRDRMKWREVQPTPERFVEKTSYDTSADAHARHGLNVLQVFHSTPEWATDEKLDGRRARGRFPRDLRHAFRFCRAMATRFSGTVQAWEPWNEANVQSFGAHTVDEMCALQKASYLGFKAGNPRTIVGWNAHAGTPSELHTKGVLENEAWRYFDTYNIHTYDRPDSYEQLWAPARRAASGRALWITESDRGIHYVTEGPWHDLSPEHERLKAHFMAQSYASSLFAGARRHFHFILGHYVETHNKVQFGLLRYDLTPRPSYTALAAVGRFLAGARCLGRWRPGDRPDAWVCAFRARPDGVESDVLVAWAEKPVEWPARGKTSVDWSLPAGVRVNDVFDYLGRSLDSRVPAKLGSSAVFVLLPPGDAEKLPLETLKVDPVPVRRPRRPSTVVLQLQMPRAATRKIDGTPWSHGYEYVVTPGEETELSFYAYNFGPEPAAGAVRVEHLPRGWRITPERWSIAVDPMERVRFTARIVTSAPTGDAPEGDSPDDWLRLRGDLSSAGRPVLALRLASP